MTTTRAFENYVGRAEFTGQRHHLQLFSGCDDSLLDYSRKRVVLSLGLSSEHCWKNPPLQANCYSIYSDLRTAHEG